MVLRQPATPTTIIRSCLTAMRLISSSATESLASSMDSAIEIIALTIRLARMLRSSPLQVFSPGKRARSIASSDVISRISFYAPYKSDPDRWSQVLSDIKAA